MGEDIKRAEELLKLMRKNGARRLKCGDFEAEIIVDLNELVGAQSDSKSSAPKPPTEDELLFMSGV